VNSPHGPEPVRRRDAFDSVADLYARYRPGYPPDVVDAVIRAPALQPGQRVLEIGCGTGQLTEPLLEHGLTVMAVELGPSLAAIARRKLARFPDFQVQVSSFEDWVLPPDPFDAVVCATAFHWLDPRIRTAKAARALRPGGALVALYPHYVTGDHVAFVEDSQVCYRKWGLGTDPDWRLPWPSEVPPVYPDIDASSAFEAVQRLRISRTVSYTRDAYVGLLRTDSLILSLSTSAREGFLADMTELIETGYGGIVVRDMLYEVVIAWTPA
jgi:SAM-dependent methyltransferase